jgi:hypothetical protein
MRLEQKKLKTTPTKRSEFLSPPDRPAETLKIKNMLTNAPINAKTLISIEPALVEVNPNIKAADAKSAAPEEIPKVNGLAR